MIKRKPMARKPHKTLKASRTPLKRSIKRRKNKKGWTLKKADTHFSNVIRTRDGKCLHPRCKRTSAVLQNSHYFGRAIKSTRFDPDNCITLCWLCHYKDKRIGFEFQKQTVEEDGFDGQYTIFMKKHLGADRFNALLARSKQSIKQPQAIKDYASTIKE